MVDCVIVGGWTIEAAAERFRVIAKTVAKTVTKWRDGSLDEGDTGFFDRSSRPHTSPNASALLVGAGYVIATAIWWRAKKSDSLLPVASPGKADDALSEGDDELVRV